MSTSVIDRDAELIAARDTIAYLQHALALASVDANGANTPETVTAAHERAAGFLARTAYLGELYAQDMPRDRQIVAHAVRTLKARADAVDVSMLWEEPSWLDCLHLVPPGRDPLPLSDADRRWFSTMTPEVGRALAALLDGQGSAAGMARAVLYREAKDESREGDD